jgi:hypothetical protein
MLGKYIMDKYHSPPEIPPEDITWFEWWNNQNDIVVQFDKETSPVNPEDITNISDRMDATVTIHIWVRDYYTHAVGDPGGLFGSEQLDFGQEVNAPTKLGILVSFLTKIIDDDPSGLESQGVSEMEVIDSAESDTIPTVSWNQTFYHWVITVRMLIVQS